MRVPCSEFEVAAAGVFGGDGLQHLPGQTVPDVFPQGLEQGVAIGEALVEGWRGGVSQEGGPAHGDRLQALTGTQVAGGSHQFAFQK